MIGFSLLLPPLLFDLYDHCELLPTDAFDIADLILVLNFETVLDLFKNELDLLIEDYIGFI